MRKAEAIEALRGQRRATLALLATLEDDLWDRTCSGTWRIRDVIAHLITIDVAAVSGRLLPLLRGAGGRAQAERWNDRAVAGAADERPSVLLAELEQAGERLVGRAQRLPAGAWKAPIRTVFGRHPVGFLAARRVLDEWVHDVDIARAAGRGPVDVGLPEVLAAATLGALPALALPALAVPTGVVRLVVGVGPELEVDGHALRRTWSVDFARRHYGERVTAAPQATIRLHAAALALLVEGRSPEGYGGIEVEGDEELADVLLAGLRTA
jgi:uncharacterized protein (TIGR03083 family)